MSSSEIAAALLLVPFALIYPTVMLREEAHLLKLFPEEFRAYKSEGAPFFPRITLFPQLYRSRSPNTSRIANTTPPSASPGVRRIRVESVSAVTRRISILILRPFSNRLLCDFERTQRTSSPPRN